MVTKYVILNIVNGTFVGNKYPWVADLQLAAVYDTYDDAKDDAGGRLRVIEIEQHTVLKLPKVEL